MRRILSFISVFTLLLTACEGDPGPPGLDGQNSINIVAQSFETNELDFLPENSFENTIPYPENIEILDTDMILVYLLWNEDPDNWRLLPQTIYTETGEFQYNFQDNFTGVSIFLDAPANFDFDTLLPGDTLNQIFRVVILPVDLVNNNNIDIGNYQEVIEYIQ